MSTITIRNVTGEDLSSLVTLEEQCFQADRLTPRRFKYWIKAQNRILLLIEDEQQAAGYGLVLLHKGTRLARLYSLAISPTHQGKHLGTALLHALEEAAVQETRLFMRLEVSVINETAISLYKKMGYSTFSHYTDYYEDHNDALRMQKCIRRASSFFAPPPVPWYHQTTSFTCGPAALIMAMAYLDPHMVPSQELELDIWREATTIFMMSGHGGCHPLGLALAAHKRGFIPQVYINTRKPLFLEGVRSEKKKEIMRTVDAQFSRLAEEQQISIDYHGITQQDLAIHLADGAIILVLISTYRFDNKKLPHWVPITAMDDFCLYIHESDPDTDTMQPLDCQHMPIAREDFEKMSTFGKERIRAAIILKK